MNFKKDNSSRKITALEVTPLVDIVFLLLIFFLLTATYVKNPNLDINLPKASLDQSSGHKKDLVIAIKENGDLRYDNQDIEIDKLKGILTARFAENQETIVVIRADEGSKHGKVVEVMDLAKQIGFAKLAIAVKAKANKKN